MTNCFLKLLKTAKRGFLRPKIIFLSSNGLIIAFTPDGVYISKNLTRGKVARSAELGTQKNLK